jgi:uncharacterized membrane protein
MSIIFRKYERKAMEFIIYIFPIIVLVYLIYIISKYSGTEPYNKIYNEYYRDKNFTEYSPVVWGYILNKKFKTETIISTILLYVKKGYISMNKIGNDYEFKIIKTITEIDELDIWTISLFFKKKIAIGTIQHLSNFNRYIWIEKSFGESKQFQNDANSIIKKYLSKIQAINYVDEKVNQKNIVFSYIICIMTLIFSVILSSNLATAIGLAVFFMVGYTLLIVVIEKSELTLLTHGMVFFAAYFGIGEFNINSLILLVTSLLTFLLIYTDNKMLRIKGNNGEVIEKALGLKRYIKDFSNMKKYNLDSINIWDEYYIYSIALGINKVVS